MRNFRRNRAIIFDRSQIIKRKLVNFFFFAFVNFWQREYTFFIDRHCLHDPPRYSIYIVIAARGKKPRRIVRITCEPGRLFDEHVAITRLRLRATSRHRSFTIRPESSRLAWTTRWLCIVYVQSRWKCIVSSFHDRLESNAISY